MPIDKAVVPELPADIYYLVSRYLTPEEIESAKELIVPKQYILEGKIFDQPRIWHDLYALYFPYDLSNDHRLRRLPETHDSWRNEFLTKYKTLSDRQKHFYGHVLKKTINSSINKTSLSSLVSSPSPDTRVNEFNLDDFINSQQDIMMFNNAIAMGRILKSQEVFNLVYAACQRHGDSGKTIHTLVGWNLFHLASACNQVDIIQAGLAALAAGLPSTEFSDVDVRSLINGVTPLYVATKKGHVEVVRLLLANGAKVNQTTAKCAATPLCVAAQEGQLEVVRLLLEKNAKVDQAADDGATPLYIAAAKGHLDIVGLLLEKGAKVNQAEKYGRTPLYVAAKNGHVAVVRLLLKYKFENTLLTKSDLQNNVHQKMLASLRDEAIRRGNNNGTILYNCAYLFQFPVTSFFSSNAPDLEAAILFYYRSCLKGVKEALVRLKECAGSNNSNANYAKAYLCLIYLLGTNDIAADEKKAAEYFTQLSRMFTYSSFLSNHKTLDTDKLIELIIGVCTFSDMDEEKRQQLTLFLNSQTDVMHHKKIEEVIQKIGVASPSQEPKENVVGSSQSSSSSRSSSSSWFWRAGNSDERSEKSAAAAAAISCRNN